MAGTIPQEGRIEVGNRIYNSTNLVVGLFTNSTLGDTSAWADIVQPDVLNGYAEVTILAGSWTVAANSITLTTPANFTAAGGAFQLGGVTANIYGAYVRTLDNKLLHFEAYGSILTILDTETYAVDFSTIPA